MDYGMSGLDAVYEVMRNGGYPFDIANSIVSAATVAYCPNHLELLPQPPPAAASDSLPVGVPITHPACDGTGIVVVGNAITPGRYTADVQQLLTEFPGSSYLRTNESCSSLRQASNAGNPIYAVYRVAGRTQEEVCAAVRSAGGDAYGKWLDNTTDPSDVIPC
jgi:hypothetical protein